MWPTYRTDIETTTYIAGFRHYKITAPMVLDGPMDGSAFFAHVQQFLCPTLAPDDIVIADNLPSHKVAGICEAIEKMGAMLRYLLNPIEKRMQDLAAESVVAISF